jgi:hypothetical protein
VTEGVFHIPAGTMIAAHSYLTLWRTAIAGVTDQPGNLVYSSTECSTLAFADEGDSVTLLGCDNGPQVVDSLNFATLGLPEVPANVSLERRYPAWTSQDPLNWGPTLVAPGTNSGSGYVPGGTPGAPNSIRNPVVINEVMYRPYNQTTAGHYEFIELYNRSSEPFDLSGMILTDDENLAAVCGGCTGVTEGVYHIPAGTVIAPHSFLTLWHTAVAGVTEQPGNLVYGGHLSCGNLVLADGGDSVTLLRCSDGPQALDSLNYGTLGLPETATNVSLERQHADWDTDDPLNWGATLVPPGTNMGGYVPGGTPGTPNSVCQPAACGGRCGTVPDGCGGTIECGETCQEPQTCGGAGVAGQCGCAPGACVIQTVGIGGGEVSGGADALAGIALSVPQGVLSTDTVIGFAVAEAPPPPAIGYSSIGPGVRLYSSTTFTLPVTLTLPFSRTLARRLDAGPSDIAVLRAENAAGPWVEVSGVAVDWDAGAVQVALNSFSWVEVVARYPQDFRAAPVATMTGVGKDVVVNPRGQVFFLDDENGGAGSVVRMIDTDGSVTTLDLGDPGRSASALAIEGASVVGVVYEGGTAVVARLHDGTGAVFAPILALPASSPEATMWTAIATAPAGGAYYLAKYEPYGDFYRNCYVMRAEASGGGSALMTPVLGDGECDGSVAGPDILSAAEPGTSVPVSFPWSLAMAPAEGLLFVADLGHRRVLALNISGAGGATINLANDFGTAHRIDVEPGQVLTVAGNGALPCAVAPAGAPATHFSLCYPVAVAFADGVLVWADSASLSDPARATVFLSEIPVAGNVPGVWTAPLTQHYSTFAAAAAATTEVSPGELRLGVPYGLAYGGPSGRRAFYVGDVAMRQVYRIR